MKGADLATIPVMLVGNKCDEMENREVSYYGRWPSKMKYNRKYVLVTTIVLLIAMPVLNIQL